MRRFLPDKSVSGRLISLLVACVMLPGAVLGYISIRAVLHEGVLHRARLHDRASDLSTTFYEQLGDRAERLAARLHDLQEQQGDLWVRAPSSAAAALIEQEPRILSAVVLGGPGRDELLHPPSFDDDNLAILPLVTALPRSMNPRAPLSPLLAGDTSLLVAEALRFDDSQSVRVLMVLSDETLVPDAADLLSTMSREHPELHSSLEGPGDQLDRQRHPIFEVRQPLDPWMPGYVLTVAPSRGQLLDRSWRRRQMARLGFVGVLMTMIVVGMLALIRGVAREIEVARLKSDFVSNVSHELRTPLTTIRIMAEMLSLGAVPTGEKQDEYHRNIVSEAERLSRLINNVLDFARIQEGRKKFHFGIGDLGDIVYEVERIIGDYVKKEGFELTTRVDGALPPLSFDRDAMIQALINLTSNAVKYSEDDRRIEIGVQADHDTIRLWVTDRGPGIDPKELPHLFEKFFRGGDHMTREVGGTGLGLAIVHHIVTAHGGTVSVQSELGEGSTFEIRLPLRAQNTSDKV